MSRDKVSPKSLEQVDENLRKAYEELLNEALPERFTDLLDQLRKGEIAAEHGSGEEAVK